MSECCHFNPSWDRKMPEVSWLQGLDPIDQLKAMAGVALVILTGIGKLWYDQRVLWRQESERKERDKERADRENQDRKDLENFRNELRREVHERRNENQRLSNQIEILQHQNLQQQGEISKQASEIAERDRTIAYLREQVNVLTERLRRYESVSPQGGVLTGNG